MRNRGMWALVLIACLSSTAALGAEVVAIRADWLIDGTGAPAVGNAILLIEGDRITAAGIADRVGTLQPGKWADVVAVPGNPLEKIVLLEEVPFVMKGGTVCKSPR